jgi:hypothetical protein
MTFYFSIMENDKYKKEYPYRDVILIMKEQKGVCLGCYFINNKFECHQDTYMLPDCAHHIFIVKDEKENK